MNRLFLIVEFLLLYFLKTDMRRQVTPRLIKTTFSSGGTAILSYSDRFVEEVQQFIVKTVKGELGLVELDTKTGEVRQAFFVKLASQSQRISFSIYKRSTDAQSAAGELDSLIENILSNLRNDPLIRKISHSFESSLVNHIKGDKNFIIDSYEDDLLNTELKVDEILLNNKGKMVSVSNRMEDVKRPAKDASVEEPVRDHSKLEVSKASEEKTLILQSEDNTAELQQQTEKLSRAVEVVHPEDNAANYGLRKGSVNPEVYAAYEKKLTELLNNVYLDDKTWTLVEETNGLRFWTQDHSNYVIQRSEIEIPYPLEKVKDYICDASFRFKYDTLLKSFDVLESLSDQVALIRVVMKGQFPVSDRDFVTCRMMFYQNKDVASP